MELNKYINILWRWKWVFLATWFVTILVVFVGTQFYSPSYEATTTLRVATSRTGQATYEDLLYSDRLLRTFAQIATGSSVKEDLVRIYNLNDMPEIDAQVLPNTELIRLTVAYPNPTIAREVANTLASIVIRRSQELDSRLNMVTIVDPAVTPKSPTLTRAIILVLGGFVGLIAGVGLVFLFENLDRRLYTSKQITQVSELTLLGQIPAVNKRHSIIMSNSSPPHYKEAFRIMRTNLFMQNHRNPLRTILITSADPGDGKSTILANLAVSIAQTGKKVVMVDGDLRKPKLHTICQVPIQTGLSNILEEDLEFMGSVQFLEADIGLITSGPPPADPASLLMSNKIPDLIKELSTIFDFILFDSPAILAVPDARLLARHADGLILVVNRATTNEETMNAVNKYLNEIPVKPLGMVINKAEINKSYYYYQRE